MVLDRITFEYRGQILIEKMLVRPPFKHETFLENSGCFLYFKENAPNLLSPDNRIGISPNEAILLKCGQPFFRTIKQTK